MGDPNVNPQNPAGQTPQPAPPAAPQYYAGPPPPPVNYPQQPAAPQHNATQNNSAYGVTYYDGYGNPVFVPFGTSAPVAQQPAGTTKSGNVVYFAPAQDDWTDYLSKVLAGAVIMGSVQWAMEKIKSI